MNVVGIVILSQDELGEIEARFYPLSNVRQPPELERLYKPPRASQRHVGNIPPMLDNLAHRAMARRCYAQVKKFGENA